MKTGPNVAGVCLCGCGETTPLATKTRRGNVLGQPLRYAPGHENRGRFSALDPSLSVIAHVSIPTISCR